MEAKKILFIDDDPHLLQMMQFVLELEGYQLVTATNGQEGIRQFEKGGVDIIITDLMMPVMDGLRFLEWLRNNQRSDVPVIVITATTEQTLQIESKKSGAKKIFTKPIDPPLLLETLEKIFTGEPVDDTTEDEDAQS
ncbi:response regulator [Magnetococcales bacterium HHB-1]